MSNRWGYEILQRVQDRATYTLALSGTPWRSDERSIVLARYSDPDGRLVCDYRYGLQEAVRDAVCRSPRIVVLDNQQVHLELEEFDAKQTQEFGSVNCLLRESPVTYEDLVHHEQVMSQLLTLATKKLNEVREEVADAGGLAVATDVEHAYLIARSLAQLGEESIIVTYRSPDAHDRIDAFRHGMNKWIISVGMISEGTDIPRLQVCCYLSRIRTEMYFRQVLGRVLRRRAESDNQAWLFVIAEQRLKHFARRVADDLPDDLAVLSRVKVEDRSLEEKPDLAFMAEHLSEQEVDGPVAEGKEEEQEGGLSHRAPTFMEIYFSNQYRQEILGVY